MVVEIWEEVATVTEWVVVMPMAMKGGMGLVASEPVVTWIALAGEGVVLVVPKAGSQLCRGC